MSFKGKTQLVAMGLLISASAQASPAIAVTEFRQEVDHLYTGCKGWHWKNQNQLRTVLEAALAKQGLKTVERQHIRSVYADEHQMENLNPKTKAKEKKFIAAKYSITGAITELGICEEEEESGINLGGVVSLLGGPSTDLNVKTGGAVSKVKLVAKLIKVETGEIIKTFESETESKDSGFGVDASVYGIGGKHKRSKTPPIERATNEGLNKIAEAVAEYLKG